MINGIFFLSYLNEYQNRRLVLLQRSTQILNGIQCELKNGLTANLAASTVAAGRKSSGTQGRDRD